jgi:hypothetical protein
MPRLSDRLQQPRYLAPWCVLAAFGSYACMYGFRKPFTAGSYADGAGLAEFDLKALLVSSQVLGYTLSKILGIRVVSAMAAAHRARTILLLIGIAYLALLGFALTPAPWSAAFLFVNGLPLGMVYGLVLGFLEGRRQTELFVAGQCASFILADGITKSVGRGLLDAGVTEQWMPFVAGTVFLAPLFVFVWMLQRIPAPTDEDVTARSRRVPMTARDRLVMLRRHGLALVMILVAYLLVTVLRSLRADFAPEIWAGLGVDAKPSIFTASEFWVALGIMLANGLMVLVRSNARALFIALVTSLLGLLTAGLAVGSVSRGSLSPFAFMVLLGFGLYVPYVAVHTTIFERIVALTRERANIGFLMYVADSVGYLAYAALTLSPGLLTSEGSRGDEFVRGFLDLSSLLLLGTAAALTLSALLYAHRHRRGTWAARIDRV